MDRTERRLSGRQHQRSLLLYGHIRRPENQIFRVTRMDPRDGLHAARDDQHPLCPNVILAPDAPTTILFFIPCHHISVPLESSPVLKTGVAVKKTGFRSPAAAEFLMFIQTAQ